MDRIVRAFPLAPGKEEELRQLAAAMRRERATEAAGFYRRYGVARESWHLQRTPHGSWVIGVTELDAEELPGGESSVPVVARRYAESEEPFDRWFKNRVQRLTGVNPDEQPLGPPTECLFDSDELESPGEE